MKLFKLSALLAAIFFCSSQPLLAEESQRGVESFGQQSGEKHHGPPPEAYTVCEGKAVGSAASFTNHKGEIVNGTCQADLMAS